MTPNQIQTKHTLGFVKNNIPSHKSSVLEVGCGDGALAKQLVDLGCEVIAIDASEGNIKKAKSLGVDARVASFPAFEGLLFDVVLFTRSLHHIQPLNSAVKKAFQILKPNGLIIIEDFAFSETDEETAKWFYSFLKILDGCDVLLPAQDSFGRNLLNNAGDFALWTEHTHEINSFPAMQKAVGQYFQILKTETAPYLYRYIAAMLPIDEKAGNLVSRVLDLEQKTGVLNSNFVLGRRLVAIANNDLSK
jgi:SAM-dependent methyltransferase